MSIDNFRKKNFYNLLKVDRDASPADIKQSFDRVQLAFGHSSMATYTVLNDAARRELFHIMETAYKVLMIPELRSKYDASLAEGKPFEFDESALAEMRVPPIADEEKRIEETPPEKKPPEEKKEAAPEQPPPVKEETASEAKKETGGSLPPEPAEFSGPYFKEMRDAKGLTLKEIYQKTKINNVILNFIEEERFELLPAEVYVRGFLRQYAKILGLSPEKVMNDYIARMRRAASGKSMQKK